MAPISPDSTYVRRPMEPDAAQWTTPAPIVYQTPSTGAGESTLTTRLKTERADKSEQTPELQRKDRRASPSLRSSCKDDGATWQSHETRDRARPRL